LHEAPGTDCCGSASAKAGLICRQWFKSAPRLEQVGDNRPKQMEHRNHRVDDELILPHRANRADGIFGNVRDRTKDITMTRARTYR
jgi:hypothetical protein